MEPTEKEMLEAMGWTIVCQSPHELQHEDGSFVSGRFTQLVIDEIIEEYKEMKGELKLPSFSVLANDNIATKEVLKLQFEILQYIINDNSIYQRKVIYYKKEKIKELLKL